MKKILLLTLSMFVAMLVISNPVTMDKAKQVAQNYYLNYVPSAKGDCTLKNSFATEYNGMVTYYTFNFAKGGYVIVTADDATSPVLGYNSRGEMPAQIENQALKSWMEGYNEEIFGIVTSKFDNRETMKEWDAILEGIFPKLDGDVAPLVTTMWDQDNNTNIYCPTNTYSGCVAIAMSQIMRYHQFPEHGNGSHSYTHPTYGVLSADFAAATYNYSMMPNTFGGASNLEKQEVSELVYHCGVAVEMNYGTDGSGAVSADVPLAMVQFFSYSPTMQMIEKATYSSNVSIYKQFIKDDLYAGRPVYYSGRDASAGGHAYVCDGYQASTDKFHINWGWGGMSNGYFLIGVLNTMNGSFNLDNAVIVGIQPGVAGQALPWEEKASGFAAASRGISNIFAHNQDVAWAAAYDGTAPENYIPDFTKTSDGGQTWQAGAISGIAGYGVSMVYGIDANTAWAAVFQTTNGGGKILKTTDGGANWTPQTTAPFTAPNGFPNVVHFWDANTGWCMGDPNGGYFEMYTTTDGGTNWARVPQANVPANVSGEYGTVGYYDVIGDTVWFGTNKGKVFKSTNRGLNWTSVVAWNGKTLKPTFANGQLGVVINLANPDNDPTAGQIKRTTDGGATWVSATTPPYTSDISFIPGTQILICASSKTGASGIGFSLDAGNTWHPFTLYNGIQFLALDMVDLHHGFAGAFNASATDGGMWLFHGIPTVVDFASDVNEVATNSPVVFTNTSLSAEITDFSWNFGAGADPASAEGIGPHTVVYTTGGFKDVTLTIVSDGNEYTLTKSAMINVIQSVLVESITVTADTNAIDTLHGVLHLTATVLPEEATNKAYTWSIDPETLASIDSYGNVTAIDNGTVTATATALDGSGVTGTFQITITGQVGINPVANSKVSVYPNPSSGMVYISNVAKGTASLYNNAGQLVKTVEISNQTINLSNLNNGIYLMRIVGGNQVISKTITIQK